MKVGSMCIRELGQAQTFRDRLTLEISFKFLILHFHYF